MYRTSLAACLACLLLGAAAPARAQDPDEAAAARFTRGPLAVSPVIRITNVGLDTNIFHDADDPVSDVTATFSPSVSGWLRLGPARVSGRTELDFVYFNELVAQRSVDGDHALRAELRVGRLTPYVAGRLSNTRHRRNLEIDARARRLAESAAAGVDVRLSGKTTLGLVATRSRVEYEEDAVFLETNLAQALNRRGEGEGVSLRYALTPLTTLVLEAERQHARFAFTPDRDSDSLRVTPGVEFKPFAAVSGRAHVGFRRRSFLDPAIPEFRGMVAAVELGYTLLGRTRFTVDVERDLVHSYLRREREYLLTGASGSVTRRLAGPWDVRATFGRHRLVYRRIGSLIAPISAESPAETVLSYGTGFGYRVAGASRLGVHAERRERQSDISPRREYERLRIITSITHAF